MKSRSCFFYFFSLIVLLCFSLTGYAQVTIKGKVLYKKESMPAPFVSIELLKHKEKKTMSDKAGDFQLTVTEAEKRDPYYFISLLSKYKNTGNRSSC